MDRAVTRSFEILECLARARQPIRLSDVAAATGLQKSTVHRILGTLYSAVEANFQPLLRMAFASRFAGPPEQ